MQSLSSLHALSERLSTEQRSELITLAAKLGNLPQDDELAMVLNAVGFTALILKDIPEEIAESIGNLRSGLSDSQREGLREDIEKIVSRSLEVTSYQNLRDRIEEMRAQEARFRNQANEFYKKLAESKSWLGKRNAMLPSIGLGVSAGIVSVALSVCAFFLWKQMPTSPSLPQYIQYAEMDRRNGDRVGLLSIGRAISHSDRDSEGNTRLMIEINSTSR